jgi:hypothetical protein
LVPPGEGTETRLMPNETCVQKPDHVFCETNYRKNTSDLSEELKINIKEVGTIAEALPYIVA